METTALGAALRAGLTAALTSRIGYEQLTRRPRKSSLTLRTSGTANPSVVLYKTPIITYPSAIERPRPARPQAAQAAQEQAPRTVRLSTPHKLNRHNAAIRPVYLHRRSFCDAGTGNHAHYAHGLLYFVVPPAFPCQQVRNVPGIIPNPPHSPSRKHGNLLAVCPKAVETPFVSSDSHLGSGHHLISVAVLSVKISFTGSVFKES